MSDEMIQTACTALGTMQTVLIKQLLYGTSIGVLFHPITTHPVTFSLDSFERTIG